VNKAGKFADFFFIAALNCHADVSILLMQQNLQILLAHEQRHRSIPLHLGSPQHTPTPGIQTNTIPIRDRPIRNPFH
jgi:hypothetical protein